MSIRMKKRRAVLVSLVFATSCGAVDELHQPNSGERELLESAESDTSDQVLAWNETALQVFLPPQNAVLATRYLAILSASQFDAVNGVTGDYEPYAVDLTAPEGSTENAAAAGAAYYTLTHLPYSPPLSDSVSAIITDAYNALPTSITGNPGFAFGEDVAAQILAMRANDGAPLTPFAPYTAPGAGSPGVWEPQPTPTGPAPALAPTWGNQTPWIMQSATQFYPEPPPALDSDKYLKDLAEVESVGYRFSTTRTATQTNIATFWLAAGPQIWSPVARNISVARGLSVSENARLFGLFNLAAADSIIQCWKVKYDTNFWRPITAIQFAGNTLWVPLHPTPPFPEYTSGHSTASGAYAEILGEIFGDDPGVPILAGWSTFSEGVDEVIDARVYSGIHYRNSDVVGARFGRMIGHYAFHHAMRAKRGLSR